MVKKALFSTLALVLVAQNEVTNAAIGFGEQNVQSGIQGSNQTADIAVQNLVSTAAMFLAIVAVLYAIWGGFNILTAGGEEEKVKKGKTVLIQAGIGLVVIWLANSIVQWIITKLLAPSV
jgi:hypothetical protein